VASGSWTGSRAVDRATPLVFASVVPPKEYTINCAWDDKDAVLTWNAPTENANGSPLTDLAGYRVYYGTDPAGLTSSVNISDPSQLTHTISDLAAGVYYFEMTAYNTSGKESNRSERVQATLGTADKAVTRSLQQQVPKPPTGFMVTP
jgi:hypothetical protein